jgi:hypothetical protein
MSAMRMAAGLVSPASLGKVRRYEHPLLTGEQAALLAEQRRILRSVTWGAPQPDHLAKYMRHQNMRLC